MSVQILSNHVNANELVESHLNLVPYVVFRFYRPRFQADKDDLMQVGTIGLIKAAQNFKDGPFPPYAISRIRGELSNHFRSEKRHNCHLGSEKGYLSLDYQTDDMSSLYELIPAPQEDQDDQEEQEKKALRVQQALSQLSEEKRVLIERNFGLNDRPAEPVYKMRGRSQQTLYKLRREALAELEQMLSV